MFTHAFAEIVSITIKTKDGREAVVTPDQVSWSASEQECGLCGSHGEIKMSATVYTRRDDLGTGYFVTQPRGRTKVHAIVNGLPACKCRVTGELYWTNGEPECSRCRAIVADNSGNDTEFITVPISNW